MSEKTLPDLLRKGLSVVFVGINPSRYSAERGHYFARGSNRFWPAFSRSTLSAEARAALGVERLLPEHDSGLLRFGFGFTDVVKRATPKASDVDLDEFVGGVAPLERKLKRHAPRVACFQGVTGWRAVVGARTAVELGAQEKIFGGCRVFVVPSPSGANARTSIAAQSLWYDRLAEYLGSKLPPPPAGGGR